MSTQAAETSVQTQIVVDAPIERAFSVFTEDFGSFKPPEHNMLDVEIAETVFERAWAATCMTAAWTGASAGGRACSLRAPDRVVFSWDISPQWQIETDLERTSEVEVRFISEAPERTGRARAPQPRSPRRRLGAGATPSAPRAVGRSTSRGSPSD